MARPRSALAVALLALVVALGGTTMAGYAAGKASGNKIIKKHSLSGNRLQPDSVTGAQVAEGSLGTVPHATLADTLPVPAFVRATDGSGWVSQAGVEGVGVLKDASGFVHVQGHTGDHAGFGNVIAVLPAGDRPAVTRYFAVGTGAGYATPGTVSVGTDGTVTWTSGNKLVLSLDGIEFPAAG